MATDAELGSIMEGYSLVDAATGVDRTPFGIVMNRAAAESMGVLQPRTLDVDGEPVEVTVLDVGGNGLASIPLGLTRLRVVLIDGTGLASLPLGIRATGPLAPGRTFFPLGGKWLGEPAPGRAKLPDRRAPQPRRMETAPGIRRGVGDGRQHAAGDRAGFRQRRVRGDARRSRRRLRPDFRDLSGWRAPRATGCGARPDSGPAR